MDTIMVSPMARDTDRMTAARIPESAPGTTTRTVTWNFVAPSAYAPSRKARGTTRSASLADGRHHRQDHEAHDNSRAEHVEDLRLRKYLAQDGGHEEQREVAVDHGWYPRQNLQHRLDGGSHRARARIR